MNRSEQGSFAVETALAIPILLIAILLLQLAWRVSVANSDVQNAAATAARAASLTSRSRATSAAQAAAAATLADRNITCRSLHVRTDTSRFEPAGTVTVQVRCTADLSDLTLLGIPGTHIADASATEVIDRYRGTER